MGILYPTNLCDQEAANIWKMLNSISDVQDVFGDQTSTQQFFK